jgi:hypothetical protein
MLFPQSFISDSFEKVDFNINVHGDYKFFEIFEILKFCENVVILNFKILIFWIIFFWNVMKTEILIFFLEIFEILKKNNGFLDSDDNARGSRITITVVCPISDVQFKNSAKVV